MKIQIPKEARRVFKGVIFDVYHWRQRMFDGSFETFEMLDRRPVVDVIATMGEKIIVLKQKQPRRKWYPALPGGGIESGETSLQAAKRELLEETGHSSRRFRLIGKYYGNPKIRFLQYLYVANDCVKVAGLKLDPGEKIRVRYVSFEEFLALCHAADFAYPLNLRSMMYEALLSNRTKQALRKMIYG